MSIPHKTLVWFRNDLRLHDHEALHKALLKGEAYAVYCFEERLFAPTKLGFPKTNSLRATFLLEAVADLKKQLQNIGSDLIIRIGYPEQEIPILVKELGVRQVFYSQEVTAEEVAIEQRLEKALTRLNVQLVGYWTSTLFHLADIPYPIQKIPDVFTNFRKDCERQCQVRAVFPTPTKMPPVPQNIDLGRLPSLSNLGLAPSCIDKRAAITWKGGETTALQHWQTYLWQKKLLHTYKETRNGLIGQDYSAKLSAWLALGCISVRQIYADIKQYEREIKQNESTYWLVFELIWRDYFRFIAKKYGNAIFQKNGIRKTEATQMHENTTLFKHWIAGETGIPFIDANMRELKYTGFMSNRGRQNVASFLVKDLKINWVWGAMYFESQLIDYDVCSNWGNWLYVAGVGNDPRENRYFNILKQAKQYDAKGEYVKLWLPELAHLPTNKVHTPYLLSYAEQKQYQTFVGADYPKPIINPDIWEKNLAY